MFIEIHIDFFRMNLAQEEEEKEEDGEGGGRGDGWGEKEGGERRGMQLSGLICQCA